MSQSKKTTLRNLYILCSMNRRKKVFCSADVARTLKIKLASASTRLRHAVRYGVVVINRESYPHEYRVVKDWEVMIFRLSGVDFSAEISAGEGLPPPPTPVARTKYEDAYAAARPPHLDKPSATACLCGVWGWVRPTAGAAA